MINNSKKKSIRFKSLKEIKEINFIVDSVVKAFVDGHQQAVFSQPFNDDYSSSYLVMSSYIRGFNIGKLDKLGDISELPY